MEKFIVFRLGDEEFGIGIRDAVEILKSQKISHIPELPDFMAGVITLRGEVIPLIDMRKRLGIRPAPRNERVVIAKEANEKVGLIVDEVREIAGFDPAEMSPPPSIFKGLRAEYMKGIGRKKDRVVIFLDLKRFLTPDEMAALSETRERTLRA